MTGTPAFDFAAYRAAVEARDVDAWAGFFADGAEWIEYRRVNPPSSPRVMRGGDEIRAFLESIAPVPAELRVSHEVLAGRRIAYRLTVTFAAGRGQIVENVIADLDGSGRIVSQVDVEAWDETV